MTTGAALRERLHAVYDEEVDRTHRSLLVAWVAFGVTFGLLRLLTYAIHHGVGPFGDISIGGAHLHHYVWGIGLLMLVGLVSLIVDTPAYNPWLGLAYGIGCALVIDEFALLLDLRDVYWSAEGRISVDAALLVMVVLGVYVTASAFWRRASREVASSVRHRRPARRTDK
ncbi:MAG: hypothetical protein JWM93_1873 [Frankiales bacterium]|nr:hypothetical protein [Frankiales bacterium]